MIVEQLFLQPVIQMNPQIYCSLKNTKFHHCIRPPLYIIIASPGPDSTHVTCSCTTGLGLITKTIKLLQIP